MNDITILEDDRLQNEQEFLALILNNEQLFEITQIKEEYLSDYENKLTFKYAKASYEKYGFIEISDITAKHPNYDIAYYTYLLTGVLFDSQTKNWQKSLSVYENKIIKYYKQDVLKRLISKLSKGQLTYDKYMEMSRNLDEIQFTNNNLKVGIQELKDGINTKRNRINFNHFENMNKILKFSQNDFLIVGGLSGTGKSGFLINLMNDLMPTYQCIYFNMEMSKPTIYKRMIAIDADIYVDSVDQPQTDYQKQKIDNAMEKIDKYDVMVDHISNNIRDIKSVVFKNIRKDKHTIVFIDHIGLVQAENKKNNLYEQVTEVAKELRHMCLEYDCTVISACQLNRQATISKEINMSMLRDSGEIEQSASQIILLKQDEENQTTGVSKMTISIAKNRDGICGNIIMDYDKKKQIFKERKY